MELRQLHKFGILLFCVIMGTVLLIANSKHLINIPGLLIWSVLLFTIPVMLTIFLNKKIQLSRFQSLVLIFIPIIVINYIYYIKIGLPVGYSDVHYHIDRYNHLLNNGNIVFLKEYTLSLNFISVYIFYYSIETICDTNIIWLATIIPPLINIIIILMVYLFINRLFSHKVALFTIIIVGWENQVLVFGHEFRTQTLAMVFFFGILMTLAIFYLEKPKKSPSKSIIIIILLMTLAASSFIMGIFVILVFICILISSIIFTHKWDVIISPLQVGFFVIFFLSYIIYISLSFESTIISINLLTSEFFAKEPSSGLQTGQTIYGDFVKWFMYCFWVIFILSFIYCFKKVLFSEMDILKKSFFISFSALFLLIFVFNFSGFLSVGRVYWLVIILIGVSIAYSIFKVLSMVKKRKLKLCIKVLVSLFIILFISTSIVKLPNYIIGDTKPIRDRTEIDNFSYWRLGEIDNSASIFIKSNFHNSTIHLQMQIKNYMFLDLYDYNLKPEGELFDFKGNIFFNEVQNNDLILLKDKDYGHNYSGRELIPSKTAYDGYNILYSNGDYILFKN